MTVIRMSVVLSVLIISCTFAAQAQIPAQARIWEEQPVRGTVRSETRPSSIIYECYQASGDQLKCRFNELEVWRWQDSRATEQTRRSCSFFAHMYEQTFQRKPAENSDELLWESGGEPHGACQILMRSRFIGKKTADGVRIPYWRYVAEYKVLKRSGRDSNLECSAPGEQEGKYTEQSSGNDLGLIEADCAKINLTSGCARKGFPCMSDPPQASD